MLGVMILYRVALPVPLPSHRLIFGAVLATAVFVIATLGLRFYLRWITSTGYTYGALATPIAFLLFAFFAGFAIMIGAELNAAIQEEFPAPKTHAHRLRNWVLVHASARNRAAAAPSDAGPDPARPSRDVADVASAEPPA
jgi:membrane protein